MLGYTSLLADIPQKHPPLEAQPQEAQPQEAQPQEAHSSPDCHRSGWYASYWNASLFLDFFTKYIADNNCPVIQGLQILVNKKLSFIFKINLLF